MVQDTEEVEQGEGGADRSVVSGAGGVLKNAAALDTVRVDGECSEEMGGISTNDRTDSSTNSTPRTMPTTAVELLRMDLAIFAYVAHETSKAAKEGGMAFYAELARTSADGTIFIFMDVRSHSTDVLRLVADTMEEALAGTSGGGGGGADCGVDGTGTEGNEMEGGKDGALNSRPRKLRRLRVPPEWMANLRSEISILQILPNVEIGS